MTRFSRFHVIKLSLDPFVSSSGGTSNALIKIGTFRNKDDISNK